MASEQRKLASILAADVVGYSRLMGRDETGTLAALKSLRQEIMGSAIGAHVTTANDGLLREFRRGVNVLRSALEAQEAMALPQFWSRCKASRTGINIGDIIVKGDDLFGDAIKYAATLLKLRQESHGRNPTSFSNP